MGQERVAAHDTVGAAARPGLLIQASNRPCVIGWIKQWSGLRQFNLCGTEKVNVVFGLHVIAYSLVCLANLLSSAMATA
jgi:hypothetical protein